MVSTKAYHVFTNEQDEYVEDYSKALVLFTKWVTEYGSARLYEETFEDDELQSEDCIGSFGYFPW